MNLMFGLPETTGLDAPRRCCRRNATVATPLWWRRVRQHFGISAPRMAVRTHLPWWGRGASSSTLVAHHRRHVVVGLRLRPDLRRLQPQGGRGAARHARSRRRRSCGPRPSSCARSNSTLESELAMTRGAQEALTKQAIELSGENAQLKEELAFLQKLVSDSSKQVGLQIQRLAVEPRRRRHVALQPARSCAAAARRTNSRATSCCRPRCRRRPDAAPDRRHDPDAARRPAGDRAGAGAQIQVLSAG